MRHLRGPGGQTTLEEDDYGHPIEKVYASPKKVDIGVITPMHDLDAPKWFWDKVLDSEVAINDKA